MTRTGRIEDDFELGSLEAFAERVMRPERADLPRVKEHAVELGASMLREHQEKSGVGAGGRIVARVAPWGGVTLAASRFLLSGVVADSLWESLAPQEWLSGDPKLYADAPSDHDNEKRFAFERPRHPEDIVALTADAGQINHVAYLVDEAERRMAALGFRRRKAPSEVWFRTERDDHAPLHVPSDMRAFVSACTGVRFLQDTGYGHDTAEVERIAELRSALRSAKHMLITMAIYVPLWVRLAASTVVEYERWERFVAEGRRFGRSMELPVRDVELLAGRRMDEFANPYEPLVHVLLRGYAVMDVSFSKTSVLFPSLRFNETKAGRRKR